MESDSFSNHSDDGLSEYPGEVVQIFDNIYMIQRVE